jgi:hypothetical protein
MLGLNKSKNPNSIPVFSFLLPLQVRVWFKNRRAKVMRERGDVKAQGSLQQVVDDIKSDQRSSPS